MNFTQDRFAPGRQVTGLMLVLLFHVALIYALMTGLAKRVVDVMRSPIETEIIEEPKKPPPPPPELALPPRLWSRRRHLPSSRRRRSGCSARRRRLSQRSPRPRRRPS